MARPAAPEPAVRWHRGAAVAALTVAFFVCPLLFFTDLTRNPYLTQIALLNAAVAAALAAWSFQAAADGRWRLPRTAADAPLAAWAAVCVLSWAVAYLAHEAFFRASMRAEGARSFAFLAANCLAPFALALAVPDEREAEAPPWLPWAALVVVWGLAWAALPTVRAQPRGDGIWEHLWDPYGGALWAAGLAAAGWLARRGRLMDFWHLALAAGALASGYAVLQYFSVEWVWPKALNPYGGRSVSTFGNPNFLSTQVVMLLPVAGALYLRARALGERLFYGGCFLLFEAALLCSLTRSSWGGALVAAAAMALHPEVRAWARRERRALWALAAPAAALVLLWPQSAVESYNPSVLGRLAEFLSVWTGPDGVGPWGGRQSYGLPEAGTAVYGPWHQRLMIWACAWQMGLESPLTGKGFGLFELFYPYYQGPMLLALEPFRVLRTHANNAHLELLETFAQTGLLGLGVFVWLCVAGARGAWALRAGPGGLWRWAAFAGVAGALADNLLNVSIHFAVPGFLFWWQAGTMLAPEAGRVEQRRERALSPGAAKAAAAAAAVLALAYSVWWARQWAREADYFAGFKQMRQAGPAASVKRLERAYRWHAREVNTNYELGNAYARAGDPEKALWAYDEALRSNAGYDEIFYNKASILANKLGREEEAARYYRTALFINPLNKDTTIGLVNLYLKDPARHAAAAEGVLAQAARVFPYDVNLRTNLGFFRTQRGDHEGALEAFRAAVRIDPDFELARKNLQTALARLGRTDEPLVRDLAGLAELEERVRRNDFRQESLRLAGEAAKAFPDSVKVRLYHGNLLLLNGRNAEAERELARVLAREPDHLPARKNLAVLYEKLGRRPEAAAQFREALRIAPGDREAQEGLARTGGRAINP